MSYSDTCAANPAKTPCPFSCTCQGHVKVYPNQDCVCAPAQARAERNPWIQQTREILATAPEATRHTYADLVEDLSTYRMLAPNPDEGLKLDFAIHVLSRLAALEAKKPLDEEPELSLPKSFMLIDSSAFFLIAHSTYATREEAVAECARVNAARNPGYKTYAVIQMMVIQHPTELPQED